MNTKLLDDYDALCQKARLDADKTAKPKTRIIKHVPVGQCVGPHTHLTDLEYEDEDGLRTKLT